MKRLNLFSAISLISFCVMALLFNGCSEEGPLTPTNNNGPVTSIITFNGYDVPDGGRDSCRKDIQTVFDASHSLGTITRYLWSFYHNGTLADTLGGKTITKLFTAAPDSFLVKLKVWGTQPQDTSTTSFTLRVVTNFGGGNGSEVSLESAVLKNNGMRDNLFLLPKWMIPAGTMESPRVVGDQTNWVPTPITLDTVNGAFRYHFISYDNGGIHMNYMGSSQNIWALANLSVYYHGPNNVFFFDSRAGVLYGWGQPALQAPGDNGDTVGYINSVLRFTITSNQITFLMNNRTGNATVNQIPQWQYWTSLNPGGWTNAMNQTIVNSSGYGQGTVQTNMIGGDHMVKIRILNNCNMIPSRYWVANDQALDLQLVQDSPGHWTLIMVQ